MKRTVRVLRRAQTDLLEIQAYIRRDNPAAADVLVEALLGRLRALERFPMRGGRPRDAGLRRAGYRYLAHGEYLVFYKVLVSQVRVHRVVHGRRSYSHLL